MKLRLLKLGLSWLFLITALFVTDVYGVIPALIPLVAVMLLRSEDISAGNAGNGVDLHEFIVSHHLTRIVFLYYFCLLAVVIYVIQFISKAQYIYLMSNGATFAVVMGLPYLVIGFIADLIWTLSQKKNER